jgi:hypothetical protein
MAKWWTLADAAALYGGPFKGGNPGYNRAYSRIERAIALGELGKVRRLTRGWIFSDAQMAQLKLYMKKRWNVEPRQEEVSEAV